MARCLVSLGANLGDAQATVRAASDLLRSLLADGDRLEMSRLFRTPPVGGPSGQPPFINAVAAINTSLTPWEVWSRIRQVEHHMGRQRIRRWEARKIDLDILLYEDLRIWTRQLKIPHPRMCMRRFILLPALDVAADWIDPVTQWSVEQLAGQLSIGRGSLVLVADREMQPEALLREVSRHSLASCFPAEQLTSGWPVDTSGRVISWIQPDDLYGSKNPDLSHLCDGKSQGLAKLYFFLKSLDPQLFWEDHYRELASRLRLSCKEPVD
jgi:2-amino-4-hydroxy-6-hydroxymethyldihydropteridine diphosphokinase